MGTIPFAGTTTEVACSTRNRPSGVGIWKHRLTPSIAAVDHSRGRGSSIRGVIIAHSIKMVTSIRRAIVGSSTVAHDNLSSNPNLVARGTVVGSVVISSAATRFTTKIFPATPTIADTPVRLPQAHRLLRSHDSSGSLEVARPLVRSFSADLVHRRQDLRMAQHQVHAAAVVPQGPNHWCQAAGTFLEQLGEHGAGPRAQAGPNEIDPAHAGVPAQHAEEQDEVGAAGGGEPQAAGLCTCANGCVQVCGFVCAGLGVCG